VKEELGKKWKGRKVLRMRLVHEGKESTRKAMLPGGVGEWGEVVARKTEEAEGRASGDIPKGK
jgi:hypothetical protein